MFVESFEKLQKEIHQTARDKGWWDECIEAGLDAMFFTPSKRNTGEAIALMHSELSEALEYARHGNEKSDHIPEFSGIEEEFADVIIRIMDFSEANNFKVADAILAKIKFNAGREHKHGKKF